MRTFSESSLTVSRNAHPTPLSVDANGNVVQLVDTGGTVVASDEYDPFGDVVLQSGTEAADNAFRFSTKYWDDETGLSYYGLRY